MITASTLSGIQLFRGLSTEDRERIAAQLGERSFAKGQFAVHFSDRTREVFFIIAGRLRATIYSAEGKQVTFQDLEAGDMFGELAAVDGLPRATDVVALAPCTLGVMPHERFLEACHRFPHIGQQTTARLAGLVRMLLERVFEFSTLGVNNRIRAELLRIAGQYPSVDNKVAVEAPPTHEEIASRVSTHREAVTRELKRLEAIGIVTWNRGTHRINRLPDLRALVRREHASTTGLAVSLNAVPSNCH